MGIALPLLSRSSPLDGLAAKMPGLCFLDFVFFVFIPPSLPAFLPEQHYNFVIAGLVPAMTIPGYG